MNFQNIKIGHIRAINAKGIKSRTIVQHYIANGEEIILLRKRFLVKQDNKSFQDAIILKKFNDLMLVEYTYSILPSTWIAITEFLFDLN